MEEGVLPYIRSHILEKKEVVSAIAILNEQVEVAKEVHDLRLAADPLVRAAIKIVEKFLKETGRICYGGQAINAHLPKELKFYDTKKQIPDYDVYSPTVEKDMRLVISRLRKAGFPDVAHREGLHEGTLKISVAYNDVLDLTYMPQQVYSILWKESATIDGIHYVGANFLRSNMYKELSQPEGEIDRWEKVYSRLVLLNTAVPIDTCKEKAGSGSGALIPKEIYLNIFQFIIQYRRILAGASIKKIYQKKHRNYSWLLSDNDSPILFFSPNPENDLIALQSIIGKVSVDRHAPISDVVPGYIVVNSSSNNNIICIIIEEYACHSYNIVRLQDNSEILVASLDTAIRLFYSLSIVEKLIGETSIHCVAQNLVDISMKIRSGKLQSDFPLFSIECMGHQHTKGSLIRAKKLRGKLRKLTRKSSRSIVAEAQ
jgi:hypothetical protein